MPHYREQDLFSLIQKRYSGDAYAVLSGVRNQTGFSKSQVRTADAIVLSLWPSRGLWAAGYEIKSRKSDLENELLNPQKAEEISKYMDNWWLVLGGDWTKEVKYPIPENWGVLCPDKSGKRLVVIKEAAPLKPAAWDRSFVCAIVRQVDRQLSSESQMKPIIEKACAETRKEVLKNEREYILRSAPRCTIEYEKLKEALEEFKRISGVEIHSWSGPNVGKAVKIIQTLIGYEEGSTQVLDTMKAIEKNISDLRNALGGLLQADAIQAEGDNESAKGANECS